MLTGDVQIKLERNFLKIYVANFICHSSQFFYCVFTLIAVKLLSKDVALFQQAEGVGVSIFCRTAS